MSNEPQGYVAYAVAGELGNQTVEGRLYCDLWQLRFESGTFQITLPWNGLRVQTAGGPEDQVFFHHPHAPDVSLFTPDAGILEDRLLAGKDALMRQVRHSLQRRATRHFRRNVLLFLAGFGLLALVLYWAAGAAVDLAVARVSLAQEQAIGDEIAHRFLDKFAVVRRPVLTAQLNRLAQRLWKATGDGPARLDVQVVDWPGPNAFSVPGGHIFVTTGLLGFVKSPDEVAGVLAHELGHLRKRHGIRTLIESLGPAFALRFLFGKRSSLALVAAGSDLLLQERFSRRDEREADAEAWKELRAAHIDPHGLLNFFKRLRRREGRNGDTLRPLDSHPPTQERIRAWEQRLRALPPNQHYEPVHLDLSLR